MSIAITQYSGSISQIWHRFTYFFSLQLDNCNLFCEDPKGSHDSSHWHTVSNLQNSLWSHLTAWPWVVSPRGLEKTVQILEWVSSHPTGYDCLEYCDTECGLYSSTCPKLLVSLCSLSSVSHTRYRGILISAPVCALTHTHTLYCRIPCALWDLHSKNFCCWCPLPYSFLEDHGLFL